jgi:flagellar hook-length control protein FliK
MSLNTSGAAAALPAAGVPAETGDSQGETGFGSLLQQLAATPPAAPGPSAGASAATPAMEAEKPKPAAAEDKESSSASVLTQVAALLQNAACPVNDTPAPQAEADVDSASVATVLSTPIQATQAVGGEFVRPGSVAQTSPVPPTLTAADVVVPQAPQTARDTSAPATAQTQLSQAVAENAPAQAVTVNAVVTPASTSASSRVPAGTPVANVAVNAGEAAAASEVAGDTVVSPNDSSPTPVPMIEARQVRLQVQAYQSQLGVLTPHLTDSTVVEAATPMSTTPQGVNEAQPQAVASAAPTPAQLPPGNLVPETLPLPQAAAGVMSQNSTGQSEPVLNTPIAVQFPVELPVDGGVSTGQAAPVLTAQAKMAVEQQPAAPVPTPAMPARQAEVSTSEPLTQSPAQPAAAAAPEPDLVGASAPAESGAATAAPLSVPPAGTSGMPNRPAAVPSAVSAAVYGQAVTPVGAKAARPAGTGVAAVAGSPRSLNDAVIAQTLQRPWQDAASAIGAATSAAPAEAAHLSRWDVVAQITDSLRAHAATLDKSITVQLNPPDLGEVRLTVRTDGDVLRGTLEVSSRATLDQLRSETPALLHRLSESGVALKQMDLVLAPSGAPGSSSYAQHDSGGSAAGQQWQESSARRWQGEDQAPSSGPARPEPATPRPAVETAAASGGINLWM